MKYRLESTLSFVKNVLIKSLTHSLFHKEVFWNVSYQLNVWLFLGYWVTFQPFSKLSINCIDLFLQLSVKKTLHFLMR